MKVASRESEVRSQAACLTLTKEGFKRFRASPSIRPFDFDPVKLKFCKRFRKRLEEEKGYRLPYSPLRIEVDFFEYLINNPSQICEENDVYLFLFSFLLLCLLDFVIELHPDRLAFKVVLEVHFRAL
ncbi:hypothetical protein AMTRI_Chr12g269300 [Amborella trichopoda]